MRVSNGCKISVGETLWVTVSEAVNIICGSVFALKNHSDVAGVHLLHRTLFSSHFSLLAWHNFFSITSNSSLFSFFFFLIRKTNQPKQARQQILKPFISIFLSQLWYLRRSKRRSSWCCICKRFWTILDVLWVLNQGNLGSLLTFGIHRTLRQPWREAGIGYGPLTQSRDTKWMSLGWDVLSQTCSCNTVSN